MGCDIHMTVEVKNGTGWKAVKWPNPNFGKWQDEESMTYGAFSYRSYDTFAILANVRNGFGFAGSDTGDGFKFISHERGLPKDVTKEAKNFVTECGDHDYTWVSFREVLDFDWAQSTKKRGWVSAETFEKWDRMKEWNPWPDEWNGGISGSLIEHISEQEMRRRIKETVKDGPEYRPSLERFKLRNKDSYCLIEWEVSYADAAKRFWIDWVPKLLKLGKPEDVRLVMSFDS